MSTTHDPNQKQSWTERIEATGEDLRNRVEDLVEEGQARRVMVRNQHDDVLMNLPLTPVIVVGVVVTMVNPVITALGALGVLLAHLKLEVVRTESIGGS